MRNVSSFAGRREYTARKRYIEKMANKEPVVKKRKIIYSRSFEGTAEGRTHQRLVFVLGVEGTLLMRKRAEKKTHEKGISRVGWLSQCVRDGVERQVIRPSRFMHALIVMRDPIWERGNKGGGGQSSFLTFLASWQKGKQRPVERPLSSFIGISTLSRWRNRVLSKPGLA